MAEDERHPDTDQIVESTGLDVDQVGRFTLEPLEQPSLFFQCFLTALRSGGSAVSP